MNKKQNILDAALKLFTENGVRATSTKSIAIEAEISEALIFRYFGTKEYLLEKIIQKGYQQATQTTVAHLANEQPLIYILKTIEIPRILVASNPDFWKMQYKIIALNPLSQKYHIAFMNPSYQKLTRAFIELGYEKPAIEAELLLIYIDGMWKHFASGQFNEEKEAALTNLMQQKYNR